MHRRYVLALAIFFLTLPIAAASSRRNLIVYFEFIGNSNGMEEAVACIFDRMLGPNDQLIIQSPEQAYGFSRTTLSQPKAKLIAMVQGKLRADISRAGQNYQRVIQDLEMAADEIEELAYPSGPIDTHKDMNELFILYRQALSDLNQMRKINDASLRRLADAFRSQEGENHFIVILEREYRPIPRREALNVLAKTPTFALLANEMFAADNPKELFDTEALVAYFKQVPLTQHFIYVTSQSSSTRRNLFENSGDMYSAFSKVAKATGGACVSIAEPVAGLEAIMSAWKGVK